MALVTNNFEGGTDGTTITTGNSGGTSGNAFDVVTPGAAGVCAFSNVAARGNLSGRIATRGTAEIVDVSYTTTHGSVADEYGRAYFFSDTATPSAAVRAIRMLDTGVGKVSVQVTTALKLALEAHGVGTTTFTNAMSVSTWYRIEWHYAVASNTATVRMYQGDSTSLIEEQSRADVAAASNVTQVDVGIVTALANVPSTTGFYYWDNLVAGASDWPGTALVPDPLGIRDDKNRLFGPF